MVLKEKEGEEETWEKVKEDESEEGERGGTRNRKKKTNLGK